MTENPELTIEEVAQKAGVHPRVIHRMCVKGEIFPNARKSGPYQNSKWVIPRNDVDAYLEKYPPVRKE